MGVAHAPDWLAAVVVAPFIGSFLGVLAGRLPEGRGVLLGRSSCPDCNHALGVLDLVPVLSWVALGGRCRHCSSRVSAFYPGIEVAALLVAAWAATEVSGWLLWVTCGLGWTLLALAAMDQRHMVLCDEMTLPLIPAGLAVAYGIDPAALPAHLFGAAAGFIAFAVIGWAYRRVRGREGLGLGDAKLLAAAGAWVSWTGLPSVVTCAAVSALLVALVRLRTGQGVSATDRMPFGPYLCGALWLVWLYGPVTAS